MSRLPMVAPLAPCPACGTPTIDGGLLCFFCRNAPARCSKPLWDGYGMPAGFCDGPAYGPQRTDLLPGEPGYQMYVPRMACLRHGGPRPSLKAIDDARKRQTGEGDG